MYDGGRVLWYFVILSKRPFKFPVPERNTNDVLEEAMRDLLLKYQKKKAHRQDGRPSPITHGVIVQPRGSSGSFSGYPTPSRLTPLNEVPCPLNIFGNFSQDFLCCVRVNVRVYDIPDTVAEPMKENPPIFFLRPGRRY